MKYTLSSRERILCAIRHQEPDHVPLYNVWTASYLPRKWDDQTQRIPEVLALGLDDVVHLRVPCFRSPEVWTRCWSEWPEEGRHPLLVKEYDTPKGVLRQQARRSDDWVHGEDIPLLSLQHLSRGTEFPIKGPKDLDRLAYLFPEPTAAQVASFREGAHALKQFAKRHGVLVEGYVAGVGIHAVHMFGQLSLALKLADEPELIEQVLALFSRWTQRQAELLLDEGVDTLMYDGWADMPDYWSVEPYRRFLKPIITRHVELAHQAGVPFTYWLDRGVMPLRQDFLDMGIDSLWGVDPLMDKADPLVLKREIGHRVCLWGGICSAITLGRGAREEIRGAVTDAIRVMGPGGGFVLLPVDQVFDDASWEQVMIIVDRWREIGEYPLRID